MKNQNEINEILREIIKRLDLIKENNQKTVLGRFLKHDVISEGLIMTHSRKSVITMLNNIGAKKYHIGLGKAYGSFSNKDGEKPNTLYLSFNDGIQTMGREYFNKLIGYMYMLGWYIANKDIPKDCYDILKNYRSFTLLFEAKFDVELDLDEVNDNFYHITKKSLIDKLQHKDEVIKSLNERIQELDDNFDKSLKKERENLQQITKTHNERLIMISYISNMYEFTPLKQQSLLSYSEKRRYNMFK